MLFPMWLTLELDGPSRCPLKGLAYDDGGVVSPKEPEDASKAVQCEHHCGSSMVGPGHDGLYLDDTTVAGVGHVVVKVLEEGVAVAGLYLVQEDSFPFRVVVPEATMTEGAHRVYNPTFEGCATA